MRKLSVNVESGNALAVAFYFTTIIATMSLLLIVMSSSSQKEVSYEESRQKAYYLAQSALTQVLGEFNTNKDSDNYGIGVVFKTMADGEYYSSLSVDNNGVPTILATGVANAGSENEIKRTIEAKLSANQNVDLPGFDKYVGALSVNGDLRKLKISFGPSFYASGKDDPIDDDGDDDDNNGIDDDSGGDSNDGDDSHNVLINGYDSSPKGYNVAGLTIEDPDVYKQVMQQIWSAINANKITESTFQGNPLITYKENNPKSITTSVVNVTVPVFSSDFYDNILSKLSTALTDWLIPNASTFITGNKVTIDTDLSVSQDPSSTTFISVDELVIKSKLSGKGNLIIQGDVQVQGEGSLQWDGNVIIIPELKTKVQNDVIKLANKLTLITSNNTSYTVVNDFDTSSLPTVQKSRSEVHLKNRGGDIDITGSLFLLSTSNTAKTTFATDKDPQSGGNFSNPHTYVKGSVVLLSDSTKKGKASFLVKNGMVDVDGTISIIGNNSKLRVAPNSGHAHNVNRKVDKEHKHDVLHPSLYVDGMIVIADPVNDAVSNAKIIFHGDVKINFQYDNVVNATNKILQFSQMLGPDSPLQSKYGVLSWREVNTHASKAGYPQ
ncbi:MAG: pilus assembly PilX N-terminal domain-containing protein [Planctomycetes bacterium]|nr:pilus assembly PilX N-terminal domain-containing protein [Planctomycetota bacterium]